MIKVVITHTDFRLYWYARLVSLTEYLSVRGVELKIVELSGAGSPYSFAHRFVDSPDNWVCLFPGKEMEQIKPNTAKKTLVNKLNKLNPDIVISGPIAFPSGAAAVFWSVKNRRKIIVFDDARLIDVPRVRLVDYIKRKVYSCVDAIFCPSPEWLSTYLHFGFCAEQLFYGVDVVDNHFWQKAGNPSKMSDFGSGYFLAIGRQIPKKNYELLLRAYYRYYSIANNPARLIMVGDGCKNTLLRSFVKTHNIECMVDFYPFLPQEKIRDLYHSASWFILPSSIGETWGLVINEAMAAGLPVLVSDKVGCASTLVRNEVNGYIFNSEDEDQCLEILNKAGSIPDEERKEMGKRSKEIIALWNIDRFCNGLYDAIQYVSVKKSIKPGLVSTLILRTWKGRYRPV